MCKQVHELAVYGSFVCGCSGALSVSSMQSHTLLLMKLTVPVKWALYQDTHFLVIRMEIWRRLARSLSAVHVTATVYPSDLAANQGCSNKEVFYLHWKQNNKIEPHNL